MTVEALLIEIAKFKTEVEQLSYADANNKEVWQLRKQIVYQFDRITFPDSATKDTIWIDFQSALADLKEKQDQLEKEQSAFATAANEKIDVIAQILQSNETTPLDRDAILAMKENISSTFDFIKQSNWPSKEMRTEAWDRFNILREQFKEIEATYYNKVRETKEKIAKESQLLISQIIPVIEHCKEEVPAAVLFDLVKKMLLAAKDFGLNMEHFEWGLSLDEESAKKLLKVKSDLLRDTRKLVNDNKEQFTKEDKQRFFAQIEIVHPLLDAAWENYKLVQKQKHEEWELKQKEREQKRAEWEQKQRAFKEMMEIKLERNQSYIKKLENRIQTQTEHILFLEKRYANLKEFTENLEVQIIDLQEKQQTASSDSYKEKIAGWIADKHNKKADIAISMADIEAKIDDIKREIEETPARIEELNKGLADIKIKIQEAKANLKEGGAGNGDITHEEG